MMSIMSTAKTSCGALFVSMPRILSTDEENTVLKTEAKVGISAQRTILTLNPVTETSLDAESAILKTSLMTMVVRYPAVPKSGTRV